MRLAHVAGGVVALAVAAALPTQSEAGWLSRIAREAAEGGGGVASKIGKTGVGALDNAAAHVASLPKLSGGTALAAHVTPEGHWKFANREGQVFTAATPEELARVRAEQVVAEARPEVGRAADRSEDVPEEDEVDPVVRMEREVRRASVARAVGRERVLADRQTVHVAITGRVAGVEVDAELSVEHPVLGLEREAELDEVEARIDPSAGRARAAAG